MTTGRPLPLLLRFMLPLIVGNIFQSLYNMVDTIIVGRFVGADALAAVGSTGTLMFLFLGTSMGLTTGFTVLTSQRFGADDAEGTRRAVANSILLGLIVSVVLTIASLTFMRPILRLMNTPENIMEDAYSYISAIAKGMTAMIFYNLFSANIRAVGNSRTPLYFLIFSAGLNIILDLLFIIRFGMGTPGAAWATVLSQGVAAAGEGFYMIRKMPTLHPHRDEWRLDPACTKQQLKIGLPMALQFSITAAGTVIMQSSINIYGSVAVAGFTAASKVTTLIMQGYGALGQTMATFVGQNFGKRAFDRIKSGTRTGLAMMLVYSLVMGTIGIFSSPVLMRTFFASDISTTDLNAYGMTYVYISVPFFITLGMIMLYRNAMQGMSYALSAMSLGIIELSARILIAGVSFYVNSYAVAVAGDAFAWLTAGISAALMYRIIWKKGAAANPAARS